MSYWEMRSGSPTGIKEPLARITSRRSRGRDLSTAAGELQQATREPHALVAQRQMSTRLSVIAELMVPLHCLIGESVPNTVDSIDPVLESAH